MMWPEFPNHHALDRLYLVGKNALDDLPLIWRAPEPNREPYGETFRTCSWCGSIHPEDLLEALKAPLPPQVFNLVGGTHESPTFHWADFKYGYPHKLYLSVLNPLAGKSVQCGSESGPIDRNDLSKGRYNRPIMGIANERTMAKWYSMHLTDDGWDAEAIDAVSSNIAAQTGLLVVPTLVKGQPGIRWEWIVRQ